MEFRRWIMGQLDRAPHILKRMTLRKKAKDYNLKIFLETGTLFGDMTYALRNDFDLLISIELDDYLFNRASKRFRKNKKIKLFHGDSGVKIVEALEIIDRPCLFWLDAHYSEGITAHGETMTPIFNEIKHIFNHRIQGHVIVVDDARLFNGTDGYPKLKEIQDFVTLINNDYFTWIENDTINIAKAR